MKTIKAADATNIQLDWLVAKAKSLHVRFWESPTLVEILHPNLDWISFKPSTDWAQGGPIIAREGIVCSPQYEDDVLNDTQMLIGQWQANLWNNSVPSTRGFMQWAYGPTPLMAAMRCFVVSKLGNTVEVPEELL